MFTSILYTMIVLFYINIWKMVSLLPRCEYCGADREPLIGVSLAFPRMTGMESNQFRVDKLLQKNVRSPSN